MTDAQTDTKRASLDEARAIAQKWHSESADVNTLADYIATALAAKDAELAKVKAERDEHQKKREEFARRALKEHDRAERDARLAGMAEAELAEARWALEEIADAFAECQQRIELTRRALEAQGGERRKENSNE